MRASEAFPGVRYINVNLGLRNIYFHLEVFLAYLLCSQLCLGKLEIPNK